MAFPLPRPLLSQATLVLRPWQEEDVETALTAGLDEQISRYRYSLPHTRDAARAWIAAAETDRLNDKRLELAIEERGALVGSVALADLTHGNATVRYWLLPAGRGRGLATTAVGLLGAWAFSTSQIGRLAAFVEIGNTASVAVLERCRFVQEGRLRQHMTDETGARVDTLLYSLLPTDLGA
jgi:RimJ/RimL family protein N-acetyltransferase